MRVGHQVVDGRTVAEMHVVDNAEFLELVEEAVHGRLVDIRMGVVDPGRELFRRGMSFVIKQRADDRPPRRRHPTAPGA